MRGGRRLNAGRKPILSDLQRFCVGMQCEGDFKAAAAAKQKAEIERVLAQSDYDAVIAKVHTIPVHKRKEWLQSQEYDAHCADIELELHALAGTDPDGGQDAPRLFTVFPQRPTGVRNDIIEKVAADWATRIGKPISISTVTRCWEEARELLKINAESLGNEPNF